jgi:hypothetical protein
MSVHLSFILALAGGLFGSFCATCSKAVCGATRFGDSIFMYFSHLTC